MSIDNAKAALEITEEAAYGILIEKLKRTVLDAERPIPYGHHVPRQVFDIEIRDAVYSHLSRFHCEQESNVRQLMPIFYSAAWELCLRGVLRPSFKSSSSESGKTPASGYSITERGRLWLKSTDSPVFLAVGEISQQLAKHQPLFGDGFHERAQEAVKCYFSGTFFACCAMAGAASESILLKLATAKLGDEQRALQIYNGKSGRKELKDKVLELGQKPDGIKNEIGAGFTILAYWRDDAAHGSARQFDSTQASLSLQLLCLFALAAEKHWSALTT